MDIRRVFSRRNPYITKLAKPVLGHRKASPMVASIARRRLAVSVTKDGNYAFNSQVSGYCSGKRK